MSTHSHEDYPEDEFDRAGRDRNPQGVHRSPRPVWRALLPVALVVVLAPLLAWAGITLLGGVGDDAPAVTATATTEPSPAPEPTTEPPAAEPTAEPTPEPEATSPEATSEPTPEPTEEESTPAVKYSAQIAVLNGSGVNGLAGDLVAELSSEGFSGGAAADYSSSAPASTTLYYNNEDLEATAREVAQVLGIDTLVESASATASSDIAIVIRSDYN